MVKNIYTLLFLALGFCSQVHINASEKQSLPASSGIPIGYAPISLFRSISIENELEPSPIISEKQNPCNYRDSLSVNAQRVSKSDERVAQELNEWQEKALHYGTTKSPVKDTWEHVGEAFTFLDQTGTVKALKAACHALDELDKNKRCTGKDQMMSVFLRIKTWELQDNPAFFRASVTSMSAIRDSSALFVDRKSSSEDLSSITPVDASSVSSTPVVESIPMPRFHEEHSPSSEKKKSLPIASPTDIRPLSSVLSDHASSSSSPLRHSSSLDNLSGRSRSRSTHLRSHSSIAGDF